MTGTAYLAGLAWFATTCGATAGAAWLLVRAWCVTMVGATRVLAGGVLLVAGALVVHLLPAAVGALSRSTAALAALALLAAASRVPRRVAAAPVPPPAPDHPERPVERLLARGALGVSGAWLLLAFLDQRTTAPVGFDAMSAYLPTAARWVQGGSIWELADWLPGFFFGATPGNGSMLVAGAMLPWHGEFLAQLAIFPFVPLTALALHCLARQVGAPASSATVLGLAVASVPVLVEPGLVSGLHDPVLHATFAAGLAFLVRHHRTGDAVDLGLAGTALGIAFGTKLYGMTAVPLVVAVWVAARLLGGRARADVARQAVVVVALVAAFGGTWVLRTAVATGNPVYPVAVPALGLDAPPDPYRGLLGATLASYADDPGAWALLRHQFRIAIGLPIVVVGGTAIAGLGQALRQRRVAAADAGLALTGVAAALVLTASYALTPYSAVGFPGLPYAAAANARYGLPALLVAAGVAAWVAARAGARLRLGLVALGVVALVDGLRTGTTLPPDRVALAAAIGLPVVAAAHGLPLLARRPLGDRARYAAPALALSLVVLAAGLAALGEDTGERYAATRYVGIDPALEWLRLHTDDGARIGIAGAWTDRGVAPTYPAFGDHLQNEVTYVGPTTDGLLGTYDSAEGFLADVHDHGIEVLLIGRALPLLEAPPVEDLVPEGRELDLDLLVEIFGGPVVPIVSDEERWAVADGFAVVATSERFVVLTRP